MRGAREARILDLPVDTQSRHGRGNVKVTAKRIDPAGDLGKRQEDRFIVVPPSTAYSLPPASQ